VSGRRYYDADSHVMETADWITPYADPAIRDRLSPAFPGDFTREKALEAAATRAAGGDAFMPAGPEDMLTKMWHGLGAFDPGERSKALDLLGFEAQLVFHTLAHNQFYWNSDLDVLYGGARAHNRAMADFCGHDRRLIAVGLVPLTDPESAAVEIGEALAAGCRAVLIPSKPPDDKSPTHPDYFPVWRQLDEAGVPFMLHVGTTGHLVRPAYRNNGQPSPSGSAGAEGVGSKEFLGIHYWPETFLSMLVLDGIFERFPNLRAGCIEQGAEWVPAMLRRLDNAQSAFKRTEPALAELLPERASDYVRRQVKFTPFTVEDVGWIVEQAGPELVMFSTDYPHVEGTKNPIERFEKSLGEASDEVRDAFYANNFIEMMGAAL
jgi:predicted TIM-barrel fold metal-dependent hydrolase